MAEPATTPATHAEQNPSPTSATTASPSEPVSSSAHDGKQGSSTALSNGSQERLTRRNGNGTLPSDEDEKTGLSTTESPGHVAISEPPSRKGTGQTSRSRRSTRDGRPGPPERTGSGGAALGKMATWRSLFTPERPMKKDQPTYMQSFKRIVFCTWLNLLLVFVPVSWALHFAKVGDAAIFVTSMLAIIPLAKLLGEGTEELALRVGQTLGGLLNATLGNATELIIAILALVKCQLDVVQSSLLGSILSNLLLVLGMCFFAGGIRFSEQGFSTVAAQLNSSLLMMSVVAVLIPAGFHAAFGNLADNVEGPDVLKMSHGIAIIILLVYVAYLVFQLWTHAHLYTAGDDAHHEGHATWGGHKIMRPAKSVRNTKNVSFEPSPSAERDVEAGTSDGVPSADAGSSHSDDEEEEEPQMNTWSAIMLLVISTVLIGVTSEWLVDSISGITESGAISQAWVGLILLPIVGNAAEHVTAVTTGYKDKMDIAIGVAVGSSIQIALFVIPLLVLIGWAASKPLTLLFDPFQSIILFLSVLIVNYTVADGRANWLEGFELMMVYVYPADAAGNNSTLGLVCT